VSVFIVPHAGDTDARSGTVGASNSFSIANGDFRVTAVGEIPAATAEQIARSMQRN
jgi:negative regulator of sigma E activity